MSTLARRMGCIFASTAFKSSTRLGDDSSEYESEVDAYLSAHGTDFKGPAWKFAWTDEMLRAVSVCLVPIVFGGGKHLRVAENE